jgi:hypothetical protein
MAKSIQAKDPYVATHGFTLKSSGDTTDAMEKMVAFLGKYLKAQS